MEEYKDLMYNIEMSKKKIPHHGYSGELTLEEISQNTRKNFEEIDKLINEILEKHGVDSVNDDLMQKIYDADPGKDVYRPGYRYLFRGDDKNNIQYFQSEISKILTRVIINGEVDLAFNSIAFKQAQNHNPSIADELVANSIREVIDFPNKLQKLELLLQNPSFSEKLNQLDVSNTSPMIQLMSDLAPNDYSGRGIGGSERNKIVKLILEKNEPFRTKLHTWLHSQPEQYTGLPERIGAVIHEYQETVELENDRPKAIELGIREINEIGKKEQLKNARRQASTGMLSLAEKFAVAREKKDKSPQK